MENENMIKDRKLNYFKLETSKIKESEKKYLILKKIYFKEETSKLENLQELIIKSINEILNKPKQENQSSGFFSSLKNSLGQLKTLYIVKIYFLL